MSRLPLFRVLHLRQFRRQPVRVFLAVVAVAAGVAITVAGSLLISSINHTTHELLRSLAGPAPLRVVGPLARGGLEESVVDRVADVEGVDAVVPMVQAVTVAESRTGHEESILAIGVDCRIEALVGAFGCEGQTLTGPGDGPVLVSPTLVRTLGSGAEIRTDLDRVPIDGVTVNDALQEINSGHVAVFALPTAQRIFARDGRLDVLYVQPEPGVELRSLQDRIQTAVGSWNTVALREELGPFDSMNGPLIPILGLVGMLSLGMSALLVYNIVALSLAERRRDLAVVAAVGASPRAITGGTVVEAGLLGLLGGVVGAIAGIGFGSLIVAQAGAAVVEQSSAMQLNLYVSPLVLIAGVVIGIVTSLLASYVPARRTRRLELSAEIHGRATRIEDSPARAKRRLAVLLIAGSVGILLTSIAQRNGAIERWQPPLGTLGLAVAAISFFGAVGAATPLLLRLVLRLLRDSGGAFRVAIANLVATPRRTSVIATSAGAAVGLACVLAAMGPAVRGAVSATIGAAADGRVGVSTLPLNNSGLVDARPSPRVLDALRGIPGVGAVDQGPCVLGADGVGIVTVCAHDGGRVVPYDVVAGEAGMDVLARGEAIIGTGIARSRGLRPGSTFEIPTPTRMAKLRIGGIWTKPNTNGYSVTVSPARFEALFGYQPPTGLYLRPSDGVSPEALVRRVEQADLDPDLYALTPDQVSTKLADELGEQVAPFWTLQRILLFVALVATLSTLLLAGVQRRRELGILGAVGFGPAGLMRMTLAEGAAAALAGGLLGVVASVGVFEAFRNVALAAVGAHPPFRFEATSAATAVALAFVVVVFGSLLPAWRTSRLQIVEAIRDE